MSRAVVAILLVLIVPLSGCFGGADDKPDDEPETWTPCEHPWPCEAGTHWPLDLVDAKHPRSPAHLPPDLQLAGAQAVERTDNHTLFSWRVPTQLALQPTGSVSILSPEVETTIEVPTGLFLRWTIDLEIVGGEGEEARGYDLFLYNADDEVVCFTDIDQHVQGIAAEPQADSIHGCTTASLAPVTSPETWRVVLEHESDRDLDGAEVHVSLFVEVSEPHLGIELDRIENVRIPSHDGIELDGYVLRPSVPAGVRVPVVLEATPYLSDCYLAFNGDYENAGCGSVAPGGLTSGWAMHLVGNGYAVAFVSTRGTGASEGCFSINAPEEQRDYAFAAQWLGDQEWSNGRVGMYGLSYSGTTPFNAAVDAPEALKTIVLGGVISDWYTFYGDPQGARDTSGGVRELQYGGTVSLTAPLNEAQTGEDPMAATRLLERACPEFFDSAQVESTWVATDDRNKAFWDERRLIDRFSEITAAVFLFHGKNDNTGHRFQEDHVWRALENAPKRALQGQWSHTRFFDETLETYAHGDAWLDILTTWYDFWLKGLGDPPRVGMMDHQDDAGTWHENTNWPPDEAHQEVLYLAGDSLSLQPGNSARTFQGGQVAQQGDDTGDDTACEEREDVTRLTYRTGPLPEPVLLAGQPLVYLEISSTDVGGQFEVQLHELTGDEDCGDLEDLPREGLGRGGIDLRYHAGNFVAQAFPVDTPTPVRIDIYDNTRLVEAGNEIAVTVFPGAGDWNGQFAPSITLHPESHLVLDILDGSLGGPAPTMEYPPRPFLPWTGWDDA